MHYDSVERAWSVNGGGATIYIYIYIYIYFYIHTHVCMHVRMYVCLYVRMYVVCISKLIIVLYVHIHRHRGVCVCVLASSLQFKYLLMFKLCCACRHIRGFGLPCSRLVLLSTFIPSLSKFDPELIIN